jgi:hypothetical protein
MRIDNWILGIGAGTAVCIAGLILLAIMIGGPCGRMERTDYVGSLDEVFASHFPHVEQPVSAEDGAIAVVESPYGFDTCDYWPSPWERVLTLLAVFVALSISGALGARLGSTILPARGAAASALGCLLLSVLTVVENSNLWPVGVTAIVTIAVITLIAGVIGYIGGSVVQIRARRAEAVRIKARVP